MKSLWKTKELEKIGKDDLGQRVYTSQLLGRESSLVLHGGGNTSVKTKVSNLFGEQEDILYVKGSGWDLATIQREGFAPVRMDTLLKMAELDDLSDQKMVELQRAAMINPYAPNPSVEAILHAIIPYKFVDHTHADAIVTITNSPQGKKLIKDTFGSKVIVVPYVMPGFILAREIYKMTREVDWDQYEGMILLNHGVFSFDHDAKKSYEKMIRLVTKAEDYLKKNVKPVQGKKTAIKPDLLKIARIRQHVSQLRGGAVLVGTDCSGSQCEFASRNDLGKISQRGPLTPDHIIRTKRVPAIIGDDIKKDILRYASDYRKYFKKYSHKGLTCLDSAPRWGILPNLGTLSFGRSIKEVSIINDIKRHTTQAIVSAECLGGWKTLSQKDLFEMEYWVLEQAKLAKAGIPKTFQGKVAIVSGAASGIGTACVDELVAQGAVVMALDINPIVSTMFDYPHVSGMKIDVTKSAEVKKAVEQTIRLFGGLDLVISNAGTFPTSQLIQDMDAQAWQRSLNINLTSHQNLLTQCIKYLEWGIDPAVLIIGSKNVPAPGPGVSAYSVPKAGLTQLARVAALELAPKKIRVNVIHPNAVFDTAIWTEEVLRKRAANYGISIEEYKTNNLLKEEITSRDVARLAATMAGPIFQKTTGAQIPIDGGNERVI